MKSWVPLVSLIVFMGIGTLSQFNRMSNYYEYSVKTHKMCYDDTQNNPASSELCSHITSAADAAYSATASSEQTSFFVLMSSLIVMGSWIYSLQKKLERLEGKSDV
jgi:hypothetical protein